MVHWDVGADTCLGSSASADWRKVNRSQRSNALKPITCMRPALADCTWVDKRCQPQVTGTGIQYSILHASCEKSLDINSCGDVVEKPQLTDLGHCSL